MSVDRVWARSKLNKMAPQMGGILSLVIKVSIIVFFRQDDILKGVEVLDAL